MSRDISLRDLHAFLAVCDARNLSKAAIRLGVAQPSLSRTVRALEDRFRLRLFDRHGRGVELTPAGAALRDRAMHVLTSVEDLAAHMDDLREQHNGSVSVLLPMHVSHAVAPVLIRKFSSEYPKASLNVYEDNRNARIRQRVSSGEVDFGLFFEVSGRALRNAEQIATEHVYLVGLPGRLGSSDSDPVDFAEVSGREILLPRRRTPYREFLEDAASRCGVHLNVVRELEMGSTLLAFMIEQEGATILPISHCHHLLRAGRIAARRIENPPVARHMVLIRSATSPKKIVNLAIRTLVESVREEGADLRWQLIDEI